jgi:phage tail-like protein
MDEYPLPAFHFGVRFGAGEAGVDASFQEAAGVGAEMETEPYREGGENRFVYMLPKGAKNPRLTLKRGIAPLNSPLVMWCKSVLEGDLALRIKPKPVQLFLFDAGGQVLRHWSFEDAYPVQWSVDEFQSTKNQVALEKIELSYMFSKREM